MIKTKLKKVINPFKNNPYTIDSKETFKTSDYVSFKCSYCGQINLVPKWEYTKRTNGNVSGNLYCDNKCKGAHSTVLAYKKFCDTMNVKEFEQFLSNTYSIRRQVSASFNWTEYDAAFDLSIYDTFRTYKAYKDQGLDCSKIPNFFSYQLKQRVSSSLQNEFYIPENTMIYDNLDVADDGTVTHRSDKYCKDQISEQSLFCTISVDSVWGGADNKITLKNYLTQVIDYMKLQNSDNLNALILNVFYGVQQKNIGNIYNTSETVIRSRIQTARKHLRKQFPEVVSYLKEVG